MTGEFGIVISSRYCYKFIATDKKLVNEGPLFVVLGEDGLRRAANAGDRCCNPTADFIRMLGFGIAVLVDDFDFIEKAIEMHHRFGHRDDFVSNQVLITIRRDPTHVGIAVRVPHKIVNARKIICQELGEISMQVLVDRIAEQVEWSFAR